MKEKPDTLEQAVLTEYKYGFVTDIDTDVIAKGLSENTIRLISNKKNEPEWMLDWRLKAYNHWLKLEEPKWSNVKYPIINYQDIIYYAAPKPKKQLNSLDEADPELLATFEKLGISLNEQKRLTGVAVDVVMDSVSIATSFKEQLSEIGVIFCSISEAIQLHPELVKKYIGSVVPMTDNYFAALNSAVFTDGSFCYIPKGVRCPMELSTYFRINTENAGQKAMSVILRAAPHQCVMKISCTQL
jgi:Fe-S cluster assembly protein SufB